MTGIVINNEEIGVPRKWVKVLRASIHNAEQLQKSGQKLSKETRMEIKGKIAWLRSVNATRYQKIIHQGLKVLENQI